LQTVLLEAAPYAALVIAPHGLRPIAVTARAASRCQP
jgi:hypothetical protein